MAKLKVDMSGVKNFFFEKGDKVALILCLTAMVVLVGFGILNGLSARTVSSDSSQSFSEAFDKEAKTLKQKVDAGDPNQALPKVEYPPATWIAAEPSKLPITQLFPMQDINSIKRLNPRVLAPLARSQPREVQMDYVRGTYFAYEVDHGNNHIWIVKERPQFGAVNQPIPAMPKRKGELQQKKDVQPTVVTRPVRMVVVHMVFPLRQQLLEYQRAFRMKALAEVFADKYDLPRFLGINVWKTEVVDGKKPEWRPLIVHDPKTDKVEISQGTREVLREAILDDESTSYNQPYLIQGLAMPLPKLAILPSFQYPEVKLEGLDYNWELGGGGVPGGEGRGGAPNFKLNLPMGGGGGPGGEARAGAAMPGAAAMPGMAAGSEVEFESKPWRNLKLPPEVADKLNDKIYVLDPLGVNPDPDIPTSPFKGPAAYVPSTPFGQTVSPYAGGSPFAAMRFWETYPPPPLPPGYQGPLSGGPGGPGGAGEGRKMQVQLPVAGTDPKTQQKPWDGLIRFFDPDVRPGKTYQYMVQVRMANPNYNKKNDVAYPNLATIQELPPSPPVETPAITIPDEFNLYAVDQKPDPSNKVKNGPDTQDAKSDQIAVQVHRWVDETTDVAGGVKYVIGDWAIAERLLVRRGQAVGREINVEIPVWKKDKSAFELGVGLERAKNPTKKPPSATAKAPPPAAATATTTVVGTGVPVDFALTNPAAMLVDYDGGKREVKLERVPTKDESASNLLILQPDGKLIVRNTRADSDPSANEAIERQQRVDQWKNKTAPFRMQDATTPGGVFPGGFPGRKDS